MRHITVIVLTLSLFAFLCSLPAPALSANIVKIGNPGLEQFHRSNAKDCHARSVWDMHYYNGSIYVGAGDAAGNRGPIDVWSFDAYGYFKKDYNVPEEQVSIFREYSGKLLVPGMDSTESLGYGNLYIKDGITWQRFGTIPGAIHVNDAAILEENIFVLMSAGMHSAFLMSSDMGQSWRSLITASFAENSASFYQIVGLDDSLIILGTAPNGRHGVYRYTSGNVETLAIPYLPGLAGGTSPGGSIRFRDGVLYAGGGLPHSLSPASPLFFLNDLIGGAVAIEKFWGKSVRDIVARDGTCYVLTALEVNDTFQGTIHSSPDLENWVEVATFTTPALPYSFELMDGTFYVGLGNRSQWEGFADAESGSIYRINLDESSPTVSVEPPAWDINRDGVINISDLALLSQHLGEHITTRLDPNPDANDDRKVDILDMILVARHLGEASLLAAN